MVQKLPAGTRVRVTIEGTIVENENPSSDIHTAHGIVRLDDEPLSVERLSPPEPQSVGSLIRVRGFTLVKMKTPTGDALWFDVSRRRTEVVNWESVINYGVPELLYAPPSL